MTILYIDGAKEAQALGAATKERVVEFKPNQPLSGNSSDITLVARTRDDATTIGGRTPATLADDFAMMIPAKKRSSVKHIYLITNEASMLKHGGLSLAQQFVDKMAAKGFDNLKVHAVPSPGVPTFGMGMEISLADAIRKRNNPGGVSAFYYANQYSRDTDQALFLILDEIEAAQRRFAALEAKSKLSKEENKEKSKLEGTIRKGTIDYNKKLNDRKSPNYRRVNILSTENYKTDMQEDCNTFYPDTPEPYMSGPVRFAINYLLSLPRKKDINATKIKQDIDTLRNNSGWDTAAIIKDLEIHNITDKKDSEYKEAQLYYKKVIMPLLQALGEQDFKILQAFEPMPVPPVINQALHSQGFFNGKQQLPEPAPLTIREQLEQYKRMREGEWLGFHYNFICIMSLAYYISDRLRGTDYYNCKHREVKISAVTKLLENNMPALTEHEIHALSEGRLGKIVGEQGGLQPLMDKLHPADVDDAALVDDADEVANADVAGPAS